MHAFLQNIDERYGGIEECLSRVFDLSREDSERIRANLQALST